MARIKSPRTTRDDLVTPNTPSADHTPALTPSSRRQATTDPAGIRAELERYRPRDVEFTWWMRARTPLIEIVMQAKPSSLNMADGDLKVLVTMALACLLAHEELTPRNLLSQQAAARAKTSTAAHLNQKSRNDLDSRLARMARAHLPGEWPERKEKQERVPTGPPASRGTESRQRLAAATMSAAYRRDAETMLDLAYHAYARPDEIRRSTGDWVQGIPGDVTITIVDRLDRPRVVPVAGDAGDRLLARAADVGSGHLIRPDASRGRAHSAIADEFQRKGAPLNLYAARKRGLVDLAAVAPAQVVAALGALRSGSHSLMEIVAHVPVPSQHELRQWARTASARTAARRAG